MFHTSNTQCTKLVVRGILIYRYNKCSTHLALPGIVILQIQVSKPGVLILPKEGDINFQSQVTLNRAITEFSYILPQETKRHQEATKDRGVNGLMPKTSSCVMCKRAGLGNGGRPSKGKADCTDWHKISTRFWEWFADRGEMKLSDQIRQKWDTFLKSQEISKKMVGPKELLSTCR